MRPASSNSASRAGWRPPITQVSTPAVRASGADIAGVRSAACRGGRRTAALDPARIAQLRTVCSVETNVNCAG